ncbi:MAG TPA: cytochrome b/b6 domain-containing protein [Burkholderiales bacterium]|nr:cytochrome b/b6 domain-containing protein [Burkholderiales bacterium]
MDRKALTHYSAPTQVLHWLTAILVLIAFIYGPGGSEERVYSAARDFGRQLHETLGLSVLTLTLLRVVWRAFDKHPAPPPAARWMSVTASVVQVALYVLLFAVPLTAISGAWLEGHALTLLGGLAVSPAVIESHDLGVRIAEIHTWLGDAIMWLAGAHALAALFHHLMLKDRVLRSMLPRRWARSR